jgi:tetratricopeptide (TPR) repeat protein
MQAGGPVGPAADKGQMPVTNDSALPAPAVEIAKVRKRARAAYKAGQFDEAYLVYVELFSAVAPDDQSYQIIADRSEFATILARTGRHTEALRQLELVVEAWPEDPVSRHRLGVQLMKLGRQDEALFQLQDSARLSPLDADKQWLVASAAIAANRFEEAEVALEACLALDPDHVQARQALDTLPELRTAGAQQPKVISDAYLAELVSFADSRSIEAAPAEQQAKTLSPMTMLKLAAGSLAFVSLFLFVRHGLIG